MLRTLTLFTYRNIQNHLKMSTNKSDGIAFILIISLATVSISFIQTAIGYKPLFGGVITWVVSLVISLLMLRTNLQLRTFLQQNRNVVGLLLFYLVIALVSFIGNFNAFYSRFMRAELYDRELREYKAEIPAIANQATTALNNLTDFNETERQVNQLKRALHAQIINPGNPGIGEKAREIITDIEKLVGTQLTILDGSPQTLADGMVAQVDNILAEMNTSMNKDVTPVILEINTSSEAVMATINEALNPSRIKKDGRDALESALTVYNNICLTTQRTIPGFECTPKSPRNLEVGQLNHTFQSAFGEMQNPSATWISVFASLLIDFLVPVFILLTVTATGSDPSARSLDNPIPRQSLLDKLLGNRNNVGVKEL